MHSVYVIFGIVAFGFTYLIREPIVHHFRLDSFVADVRKHAKAITSVALLVGSIGFLYRHVIVELIHDWATDDNYSHGFLVVPIALCVAWHRRNKLHEARSKTE